MLKKNIIFGAKVFLIWYCNLKKLLPYSKSARSNLSKCKDLSKTKIISHWIQECLILVNLGQILKKTTIMFEISTIEFAKMQRFI